jgi:pimeloyl-ACP methyl ester carboxylesterase
MKTSFLLPSLLLPFFLLLISACQREEITIANDVSETFYVERNKASMRVLVEGNTASQAFLLFIHGGPGASAYLFNTDYISRNLEDKYALVYFDQRNAGASQGGANGEFLNLEEMTEDITAVIATLKHRYGDEIDVFMLGHSFGGLLSASFVTQEENQSLLSGWIVACGAHNYRLSDSLAREMLIRRGQEQIDNNIQVGKWQEIIDFAEPLPYDMSLEESNRLNGYSHQVETQFVDRRNSIQTVMKYPIPTTSVLLNSVYAASAPFNEDLLDTEFSSSLNRVTLPTLLLFGEHDFVCPQGLGEDIYARVETPEADKKLVVSPVSGHDIFYQDEVLFCNEISAFIDRNRE